MGAEAFIGRCAKALPGAELGEALFSDGVALWAGQREIAHAHGEGTVEIRLTKDGIRARRVELRADGRVKLRKNASDWLEFDIVDERDETDAFELVRTAITLNALTAKPGPPSTGADLARRRRFH
ncbi:MAG: hypothetical protein QOI61_1043 [Actinomycetota bacterium]